MFEKKKQKHKAAKALKKKQVFHMVGENSM